MVLSALLWLALSIQSPTADVQLIPWERTMHWDIRVNADTGPWESPILDSEGRERYRVSVIPLWAVEGGVTAFEIALTSVETPNVNLLGTRQPGQAAAFVIEASELKTGIGRSTFGKRRSFAIPGAAGSMLDVSVLGSRLGTGAGMCDRCSNVQEFRATVSTRPR